jgi:MEMO1 family protein
VAGYFYPGESTELLSLIKASFLGKLGPGKYPETKGSSHPSKIECFVVPHAGYVYSGQVAAHSYYLAQELSLSPKVKTDVIILGPNHYGLGSGVAVSPDKFWKTPLGDFPVNEGLSKEIVAESENMIDVDATSHSREHSIEVQIPFLQALKGKNEGVSFVPICLMMQDNETTEQVAKAIIRVAESKQDSKENFLILASSDLTHYEPHEQASAKDKKLLKNVAELDVLGFYSTLERNNITACGYGAIAAAMRISHKFGKKTGSLLKYATSGDVTGDTSAVVGYSAVHFT